MITTEAANSAFTIGAVSRLAGISIDSIRAWERRYGVVSPQRTDQNKRRYSHTEVMRLSLLKQLVDRGHAVSTVADLPDEELRKRLELHAPEVHRDLALAERTTVLIYGSALPFLLEGQEWNMENLAVIGAYHDFPRFEQQALVCKPDVLVLEYPALNAQTVDTIVALKERSAARHTVAVYAFSTAANLRRMANAGIVSLRAPVTLESLQKACVVPDAGNSTKTGSTSTTVPKSEGTITPRRFDDKTLATLAKVSSSVICECPHQVTDLLFRLNAFEAYSADCENRNEKDATLHLFLHRQTAHARRFIEEALQKLIEVEGIELATDVSK